MRTTWRFQQRSRRRTEDEENAPTSSAEKNKNKGKLKSGHSKGCNPQFFKNRFLGEKNS